MNSTKNKDLISGRAFARVNLLGNPSDIYGGFGLGFPIWNWFADVMIDPNFSSDEEINLLRAAREVFSKIHPIQGEFGLRHVTNIPMQLGFAGSSALVMAALRVLAKVHNFKWTWRSLADATLAAESEFLDIIAGPMDRWIQAQEKFIWMNFSKIKTKTLPLKKLPSFRIFFSSKPGDPSGSVHAPVMARWKRGDPFVKKVMDEYGIIVEKGLEALMSGDLLCLAECMDRNFELRSSLFPISNDDQEIINLCRSHGAAAKLCGSGGAIIALMRGKQEWINLEEEAKNKGISVAEPQLFKV